MQVVSRSRCGRTSTRLVADHRPYPLAAALGQLGRIDEARIALEAAMAASPAFFEFITQSRPPYYYRPEDHGHMLDGLRKAGWRG